MYFMLPPLPRASPSAGIRPSLLHLCAELSRSTKLIRKQHWCILSGSRRLGIPGIQTGSRSREGEGWNEGPIAFITKRGNAFSA